MADNDEKLQEADQLLRMAQGFMSDADFREEVETKITRYLQSVSASLIALGLQNQVTIDLLKKQGQYGDLPEA